MDQDRFSHSRRELHFPERYEITYVSPLDNEQLARTSADGTRPHRASKSRGRDPRVERTHTVPPHPTRISDRLTPPFLFLPLTELWSLRLSSLVRLRLFNQASAEATNLFGALAAIEPPSARAHVLEHVLPFELDVIHARVKYWAGDAHGYTDALGALLRRCRRRARGARLDADRQMWIERGARVGLIAASHFIEIKVSPLSSLFPPLFSFPIL